MSSLTREGNKQVYYESHGTGDTAIVLVHGANGWNVMNGGMEFQVLMLAAGLYFAARGNNV